MKKRGWRISIVMKRSCDLCVTVRCLREGDPADLTLSLKKKEKKKIFSSSLSPPLLFTLPKLPLLYFESCTKWKKVLSPPSPIYAGGKEGKDFFFSDPSSSGPPPPLFETVDYILLIWNDRTCDCSTPLPLRKGEEGMGKKRRGSLVVTRRCIWFGISFVSHENFWLGEKHIFYFQEKKKKTRRRWWIFSLYNQLKMNKFVLFLLFVCGCW